MNALKQFLLVGMLCGTALVALPMTAVSEPTPEQVAKAEDFYVAGVDCYRDKNYVQAAEFFRKSYDLVPKPTLLYNEAYAWALAGDMDKARAIADETMTQDLSPDLHAKVTARIVAWNSIDRKNTFRPSTFEPRPIDYAQAKPSVTAVTKTPAQAEPSRKRTAVAPIVLGATGLAALAAAGIIEWQVAQVGEDLDLAANRRDQTAYDEALARGESLQLAGKATLIGGGVLLGAAVVVWLIQRSTDSTTASLFQAGPGNFSVRF